MSNRIKGVYLIKIKELSFVKIGCSNDLFSRTGILLSNFPNGGRILGFIYTDDFIRIESDLHKEFKEKRLNGEWFDLSSSDVEYILNKYNSNKFFYNNTRIENIISPVSISDKRRKVTINRDSLSYLFKIDNSVMFDYLTTVKADFGYKHNAIGGKGSGVTFFINKDFKN